MINPEFVLPPELQSGQVIELSDFTELHSLENTVASAVDPYHNEVLWAGRVALKDLLRPAKFNGRITNLELMVMEDPYERLLDATERGWSFVKGIRHSRIANVDRYVGFTFVADAFSTGRGRIGQVQAELWYAPDSNAKLVAPRRNSSQFMRVLRSDEDKEYINKYQWVTRPLQVESPENGRGFAPVRIVAKPKLETKKFIELNLASQRIGLQVLRNALKHPIINGITQ